MNDGPAFCSWSGGKDSALAMYEASRQGLRTDLLITMMTETGLRSRSHGLRREVLEAQAQAVRKPIRFVATSWEGYERAFIDSARTARSDGLRQGIFGDIDVESHRQWVVSACSAAAVGARLPVWGIPHRDLLQTLIDDGFRAVVIAVRAGAAPLSMLGETIDASLVRQLERDGVDPAGEGGEYHSLVVDGPDFVRPVGISLGRRVLRDGVWFLDCRLK